MLELLCQGWSVQFWQTTLTVFSLVTSHHRHLAPFIIFRAPAEPNVRGAEDSYFRESSIVSLLNI